MSGINIDIQENGLDSGGLEYSKRDANVMQNGSDNAGRHVNSTTWSATPIEAEVTMQLANPRAIKFRLEEFEL